MVDGDWPAGQVSCLLLCGLGDLCERLFGMAIGKFGEQKTEKQKLDIGGFCFAAFA